MGAYIECLLSYLLTAVDTRDTLNEATESYICTKERRWAFKQTASYCGQAESSVNE